MDLDPAPCSVDQVCPRRKAFALFERHLLATTIRGMNLLPPQQTTEGLSQTGPAMMGNLSVCLYRDSDSLPDGLLNRLFIAHFHSTGSRSPQNHLLTSEKCQSCLWCRISLTENSGTALR